ncbi:protein of unknown function DUF1643 [Halothece sp. PCC 7418]|nr:protein of unknown function DUF1643 [Halothece sp. PCC 7418]
MQRGAIIDPTGCYRYLLWREWKPNASRITFIMLNPSRADATVDDPTIRRYLGFAQDWGYDSLAVVNLFAYRTFNPTVLKQDKRKAVVTLLQDEEWSQWSDRAIARQCQVSHHTVAKIHRELTKDNSIWENAQMGDNHTRKVKRGEQVYEQRQRNPLKTKASQKQEPSHPSHPKKSVIPEIRPDVHVAICQFLNLEVEAQPNQYYQQNDRAYLIASHDPEEMDLFLERLFAQLEGEKIQNAITVTSNQAEPQNKIKERASVVCLISNTRVFLSSAGVVFREATTSVLF